MRMIAKIIMLSLIFLSSNSIAETPNAQKIVEKAYNTKRVDDQVSTLTFYFTPAGKKEMKVVYTMIWKNMHGKKGLDNKAIFFTEYPPDRKGIAYLGWLVSAGSAKQDDEWIYLPELRMTRRIAKRSKQVANDADEFGNSILTREHLDPRPPHIDDHTLLNEEMLNGKVHYRISSIANDQDHGRSERTTSKIIQWVDKESYRINRMQFFSKQGIEVVDMKITWEKIKGYWVWQAVEATNPENGAKTSLEISNTKINSKLKDRVFTKRILEKGPGRIIK
ncbi:outer membrane lipoprotein-sorting protein [Pseudomonadota bacterium]